MRRTRADRRRPLEQPLAPRRAAALDEALAVSVVVVRQLFAFPYVPGGPNPNHTVLDVDIAVRTTGMIDVPGVVAAHARVDDPAVGQFEAPDVAMLDVAALPFEALLVRDLLAGVVDDALVLANRRGRVDAPAVDA